jgi:hypothetical protein
MMHSFLSGLPELEADELESEAEKEQAGEMNAPAIGLFDSVVDVGETTPALISESTALHPTPHSSGRLSLSDPQLTQKPELGEPIAGQTLEGEAEPEKLEIDSSLPTPPSPASSISSLPPQITSSNKLLGPTVPLSRILQEADRLRSRYPISHKALRLEETMGPESMLRTWSADPNKIMGDSAAEEVVLRTDLVVLPDLDDDVFEPYIPPAPKPARTRLAVLPKLDLGTVMSIGLPMMAIIFAVASNSPTARGGAQQALALAFNFVEVGGIMV